MRLDRPHFIMYDSCIYNDCIYNYVRSDRIMKEKNEKNGIVTLLLMTAATCFIYMMNSGIRNNFGIMLQAITENTGLTFASVSFVLAIAQLWNYSADFRGYC